MKPLLEADASELERGLLDSLRFERPSAELEQRMRDALGLGPAGAAPLPAEPVAPAAPAAKTFGSFGSIATGTVVAALFVGGGALLGQRATSSSAPAPAEPAKLVAPKSPASPAPTPAVAPEPRAPEPAVGESANESPRARKSHSGSAPTSPQSLREEIRLIDSARVAVKKNDATRALGILDRYEHRFPDGTFQEEARVLRAEALKTQGGSR